MACISLQPCHGFRTSSANTRAVRECQRVPLAALRGAWRAGKTKGQPWDPTVYATRRRIATMLDEWADLPMTYVSTSLPPQPGFEALCDARACAEGPRCVACSWNASAPGRLYEQRLARSEFSLIIRGDSPTTSRLYDALVNGVRAACCLLTRLRAAKVPGWIKGAGPKRV